MMSYSRHKGDDEVKESLNAQEGLRKEECCTQQEQSLAYGVFLKRRLWLDLKGPGEGS